MDALVARLYGLTEGEFAYILSTFPLVAEDIKTATLAAYQQAAAGNLNEGELTEANTESAKMPSSFASLVASGRARSWCIEQSDFILNCDIKCRLGRDAETEEE